MEPFPEELNRKLNLSQWIRKFDKHLLENPKFYEYVKEYFYESYRQNEKLRNEFHNDFLPELDSNLGFPSSKEFYKYEYFFKPLKYTKHDLANFYFYDDDINLFKKSNSLSNIKKKDTKGNSDNDDSQKQNKNNNLDKEKKIMPDEAEYTNENQNYYKFNYNKNIPNDKNHFENKNKDINSYNNYNNNNSNDNSQFIKKKSYKSDSNYTIKEVSSIPRSSRNIEESENTITNNNNKETFGKERSDYSESKSKAFQSSKTSNSSINKSNNTNDVIKKPYLSKRFKKSGNIELNNNENNEENLYVKKII